MRKLFVCACLLSFFGCSKGIVGVEGWKDGVAFCEPDFSIIFASKEATVWNDGIATYIINAGHFRDSQTRELVKRAKKVCSQM